MGDSRGMESVTVLDGGFSTQLALVTGEEVDGHPLWSSRYLATNPDAVLRTHLEFLNAGAEVIITNSYQASITGFMTHLSLNEHSSYDLMRESVRIARRAVDMYMLDNPTAIKPKIAGSVGPYGACLHDGSEYTGAYVDEVDMKKILDWHRPRIEALTQEGVDYLALETIPALSEAEGLVIMMKEYPEQKFWMSFQCRDDTYIAHGETFKKAVETCWGLNREQLVAVGCNCVNPKFVKNLLQSVRDRDIPFIVYPNSGEEYSSTTGWSGKSNGIDFTDEIGDWIKLGVRFVGGCCRTDAGYVSRIRDAVERWSESMDDHVHNV